MIEMNDESDHYIDPQTVVAAEIILSDKTNDHEAYGQAVQMNYEDISFFTVDIRTANSMILPIGVFSRREDALAYAARMIEKYQAPLTCHYRSKTDELCSFLVYGVSVRWAYPAD